MGSDLSDHLDQQRPHTDTSLMEVQHKERADPLIVLDHVGLARVRVGLDSQACPD